ncbi:MAG: 16S rRNA (guanine(527)-N(7))-methyltransferase RsmG [Tepidiformaceae bacterium]
MKQSLDWDALAGLFPEFQEPGRWLPLLQRHAQLLEGAAPRVRASSVPAAEAVRRHYAESLEVMRLAPGGDGEGPLADVGSGGGFPGMVMAAVAPGCVVHLVEPLGKRAHLLEEMAAALGLANVRVHRQRAEEAGRGPLRDACALVIARAVAPLRELLEYTAPLAAPGGAVVLPKGSALEAELAGSGGAQAALGCWFVAAAAMRADVSGTISVAVFRKEGPTPEAYPRAPGRPRKRPL